VITDRDLLPEFCRTVQHYINILNARILKDAKNEIKTRKRCYRESPKTDAKKNDRDYTVS